jgi:hypothetical protein
MDIINGDILVVGSTEYHIKAVGEWDAHRFGISRSFNRRATVSCSTKRRPTAVGAKQAVPTAKLSGLKCTPLDPVNPNLSMTPITDTPVKLLQTFITDGTDFVQLELSEVDL